MLSLFVFQAKPSLADQNVILVFVIGGVNGLEVASLFFSLRIFLGGWINNVTPVQIVRCLKESYVEIKKKS